MGSTGQIVGGVAGAVVGGVIGYFAGGPYGVVYGAYLGGSLGMAVGTAVDPPKGPEYGISQYKKQDLYFNTTAHNLPVPIVYGINRVAGNVIWLGNVWVEVRDAESEGGGGSGGKSGGGKKGGGSGPQEIVVHGDCAVAISEGEIAAVTEVFVGDRRFADTEGLAYTVYLGDSVQTADPRIQQDLGALAPAFRHTAYITFGGELGSAPSFPILNVEAVGKCTTANGRGDPVRIVEDFLNNPRYGCGVSSTRIDSAALYTAAQYCGTMVPNGVTSSDVWAGYRAATLGALQLGNGYSGTGVNSKVIFIWNVPSGYSARLTDGTETVVYGADICNPNSNMICLSSTLITATAPPEFGDAPPTIEGRLRVYSDGLAFTNTVTGALYRPNGDLYSGFRTGTYFTFSDFVPEYWPPTMEPRFTLDFVVDQYRPAVEHLRDMLSAFRGYLTWSQGIVKLKIEQPDSVTQSFGMNEILTDTFVWKKLSYRERPNVIRVEYVEPGQMFPEGQAPSGDQGIADSINAAFWTPPSNNQYINTRYEYKTYRQDFVEASDPWDQQMTGERRERVFNLTGIKRRSQAQRMAYYYLNRAIHCPSACAFRVNIGALQSEVGDVIAISHDIPKWAGKQFRIVEISEAEDDTLALGCLEYNAAVYSDQYLIANHGQNDLPGQNVATGVRDIARFTAYERPYENTVEFAYTRIATDDLFAGTDLYIKRDGADWEYLDFAITPAPTAYLTTSVPTHTLTASGPFAPTLDPDPFTIRGVPDGYSARLLCHNNNPAYTNSGEILAGALSSMGTVVITPTSGSPGSGYIQLYSDGNSYMTCAAFGRWPAANSNAYRGGDLFDYRRVPQLITATQTWVYIERPYGGWTSNLRLRLRWEQMSFSTFTDSMLSNVARGVPPGDAATTHTGIVSVGMVAVHSDTTIAPEDFTPWFTNPNSALWFFTANSQMLYIGAESRFTGINLWLAKNASHPVWLYGEYSTGIGDWALLTNSFAVRPVDTTSGLQWLGQIAFEPQGNWEPTNKVSDGGFDIGDTTSRYYVRLLRTSSLCTVPPAVLELTLTNDQPITVRRSNAFLYPLTLADSGQVLSFKAMARSALGGSVLGISAPTFTYTNT